MEEFSICDDDHIYDDGGGGMLDMYDDMFSGSNAKLSAIESSVCTSVDQSYSVAESFVRKDVVDSQNVCSLSLSLSLSYLSISCIIVVNQVFTNQCTQCSQISPTMCTTLVWVHSNLNKFLCFLSPQNIITQKKHSKVYGIITLRKQRNFENVYGLRGKEEEKFTFLVLENIGGSF